jgi:hypothetical protein
MSDNPVFIAGEIFAADATLQPSSRAEWLDHVSHLWQNGDILRHPVEGVITNTGRNLREELDDWVARRPHVKIPQKVIDGAAACWLDGSLKAQGIRWRHFKEAYGSDAAADRAMAEEAALYSTKPGSTTPGIEPGDPAAKTVEREAGNASSPFNPKRSYPSAADRLADIERYIAKTPSKQVQAECKLYGVDLAGRPLAKKAS